MLLLEFDVIELLLEVPAGITVTLPQEIPFTLPPLVPQFALTVIFQGPPAAPTVNCWLAPVPEFVNNVLRLNVGLAAGALPFEHSTNALKSVLLYTVPETSVLGNLQVTVAVLLEEVPLELDDWFDDELLV